MDSPWGCEAKGAGFTSLPRREQGDERRPPTKSKRLASAPQMDATSILGRRQTSELRQQLGVPVLLDRLLSLLHQCDEVTDVVQGVEAHGEDLSRHEQVP